MGGKNASVQIKRGKRGGLCLILSKQVQFCLKILGKISTDSQHRTIRYGHIIISVLSGLVRLNLAEVYDFGFVDPYEKSVIQFLGERFQRHVVKVFFTVMHDICVGWIG